MPRLIVLLLLLANLTYLAWSQRWLASYGWAPVVQSEPERIAQQVAPETLHIITAKEALQLATAAATPAQPAETSELAEPVHTPKDPVIAAPTAPTVPTARPATLPSATTTECLQAGIFTDTQAANLRSVLQSVLPAGSWQLNPKTEPARWIIYMGQYDSPRTLEKKKAQLRHLKLAFSAVPNPDLEPGLSLGSFATSAQATQALARLGQRGVRTAKVVQTQTEMRGHLLKLPKVDTKLRSKLVAIKPDLGGRVLQTCKSELK